MTLRFIMVASVIVSCQSQPIESLEPSNKPLPAIPSPVVDKPRPPKIKSLSEYETKFDPNQKDRAWNISLVANKLNGAILHPGKQFSFNEQVGPRDATSGFRKAPVIFMGEMDKDFGGGTCQASSTLYAASLKAGLGIVHRRGHSRPSVYIGKGLDATVAYPDVDLIVSNPYKYDVIVRARTTDNSLIICMDGDERIAVPSVKWRWEGGQLIDYERRYRKRNNYRNDHKRMKQRGQPGQNGFLLVKYTLGDNTWTNRTPSSYKPVDEVWEVGLAWDMEQKPWD